MNQEFVIQSEVSQKEKNKYHMLTHTHTHIYIYIYMKSGMDFMQGKERVGLINSKMFLSLLINIYLYCPQRYPHGYDTLTISPLCLRFSKPKRPDTSHFLSPTQSHF